MHSRSVRRAAAGGLVAASVACMDGSTAPRAVRDEVAPDKQALAGRGSVRASGGADANLSVAAPSLDGSGGDAFYTVFVDESPAEFGIFTVGTGPSHPLTTATGARQSVLYGGSDADPFSSYLTVRSYTSDTDYPQGGFGATSRARVPLRPGERGITGAIAPLAGGFRTTYVLPGPGATTEEGTPDRLRIEQVVRATGTSFDQALVEVTTVVTNTGEAPVQLGLRYLWDTQVERDDGPAFSTRMPDTGPFTFERSYAPAAFSFFEVQSNRDASAGGVYRVFGTVTGPGGTTPAPSGATRFVHASWPDAYNSAYDFTLDPSREAACAGGCDNAVLYYLGDATGNAVTVAPEGTISYTQWLAAGTMTLAPTRFTNRPPVPSASGPYRGVEGAAIAFRASASDPDGDPVTFAWDLDGDGVTDRTGATTTFAYRDDGAFTARLTATDARGATATITTPVTVSNSAPVVAKIRFSLPELNMPGRGKEWSFDFQIADRGRLDAPWTWTVNWGDGSPLAVGTIGALTDIVAQAHTYATAGSRAVRITVTDGDGATGTRAFLVFVQP